MHVPEAKEYAAIADAIREPMGTAWFQFSGAACAPDAEAS